jgi:1,4-dihydroxy-2-naphthoate octaprenyltransferase
MVPVLLGGFAAYYRTGSISPGRLVVTLAGIACVHLGANLANDYFDWKTGCDTQNPEPTPYSGGSRVIQDGLMSSRSILAASVSFFLAGALLGFYLNSLVPGNAVIIIGVIGIAGGLFYTALPVKLSYRGLGEMAVFFCFGPLLVAGSYLVQAGRLDSYIFAVSVPAGLLVLAILLVNEVLDEDWDRKGGKRTLVVTLGRERGYRLFLVAYVTAYVWIGVGIALEFYQPVAAVAALPLLLGYRQLVPGRALASRESAINASKITIRSQMITVLLLSLSFLI